MTKLSSYITVSTTNLPAVTLSSTANINKHIEKHGFVVIENAVTNEQLEAVRREIETILTAEAERYLDTDDIESERFDAYLEPLFNLDSDYRGRLYDLLQDMHSLGQIAFSDWILTVAEERGLDAPNLRNFGTRIDIPGEDEYLQPIHQDLNNSETSMACWIPLRSVTPENGALRVFPGSHELGPVERTHEEHGYKGIHPDVVEEYEMTHCSIDAGDAVVMHPCLIHQSETNRSDHIRWSITVRYNDATDMAWLREGHDPFDDYR